MAFYDKFPYTNFQELNLDKIMHKIGDIDRAEKASAESSAAAKASEINAENSQQEAAASALSASQSADASAASALESAQYLEDIGTHTAGAVADWLAEHVTTPTTPPVDTSLTIAGAAADAKVTGDAVTELKKSKNDMQSSIGTKETQLLGDYTQGSYWGITDNKAAITTGGSSYYAYDAIPVNSDAMYHLRIKAGGSTAQRALLFVDSDYNILYKAPFASNRYLDYYIYPPENSAYALLTSYGMESDYAFNLAVLNDVKGSINAIDDNLDAVNGIISASTKWDRFAWDKIATSQNPTGFRTGYINDAGKSTASTVYIRSSLIPAELLSKYSYAIITPPEGYFVWASVFVNDYVGEDNFVAQYGDYAKREINKKIHFPISAGQSVVISAGRFATGTASDYLTTDFVNTIIVDLLAASDTTYTGKHFSILGDSISAFAKDIPAGNRSYYTGNNMGVTNKSQMWYRVAAERLGMIPLVINGWSGSCVTSGIRDNTEYLPASNAARCEHLHDGDTLPDIILVAMGVNDYSYMSTEEQFGTWAGYEALGSQTDMSDYDVSNFRAAYATMLARIRKAYPNAEVFCITPWFVERNTTDTGVTYLNAIGKQECDYGKAIHDIADIMGCQVLDGTNIGFNRYNFYPTYAEDSSIIPTHPNAAGHAIMGNSIAMQMLTKRTH